QTNLSRVWGNMSETELKSQGGSVSKPSDADVKDNTKASSVADYVNKWYTHISSKQLDVVPKETTDTNKNTWDAFKDACFVDKAPATTSGA
ncbi:hypothetical protein, partial [Candidatus Mycoplasma haematohominis]|uniref:hypothetical protein n=1 Tax=Candidatus Mycoplasma haematohominis TaxID=1494318 RepID=UPI001C0A72F2